MPRDRKFVNPLTQPSTPPATLPTEDTSTLPSTETPTLPPTETATSPSTVTFTSTDIPAHPATRKRGSQAFEHTHERVTWWLDKGLKKRFDDLAKTKELAKSTLFDEAITDLLKKYGV